MTLIEISLSCDDAEPLGRFYGDLLGLATVMPDRRSLQVQAGWSRILFERTAAATNARYHFAFNIPRNRVDQARAWLRERVPLLAGADGTEVFRFEAWRAHAMYFRDPAGNVVELIARDGLENDAPGAFGPDSLLCVSEIGVASEDVLADVKASCAALGVLVFRGEPNDTFTPVGDGRGLLIVVRRGRVWFPDTGVPAEAAPLRVLAAGGHGHPLLLRGPPYRWEDSL